MVFKCFFSNKAISSIKCFLLWLGSLSVLPEKTSAFFPARENAIHFIFNIFIHFCLISRGKLNLRAKWVSILRVLIACLCIWRKLANQLFNEESNCKQSKQIWLISLYQQLLSISKTFVWCTTSVWTVIWHIPNSTQTIAYWKFAHHDICSPFPTFTHPDFYSLVSKCPCEEKWGNVKVNKCPVSKCPGL